MIRSLSLAALLASPVVAFADPPAGQIDPTFNEGEFENGVQGLQIEGFDLGFNLDDLDDEAYAMAQDTAGRLIIAGVAETNDGYCLGLMRFTPDGQLDKTSFGFNTNQIAKGKICHSILTPGNHLGFDLDIAVLPDDGFVVGGIDNFTTPFVCRFQPSGKRSETFGSGTGCISLSMINSGNTWLAPTVLVDGESLLIVTNHASQGVYAPVVARLDLESGASKPYGQEEFVQILPADADAYAYAWGATLAEDGDVIAVGEIEVDPGDKDAFVARFDMQQVKPDVAFSEDGMTRFKLNQVQSGANFFRAIALLASEDVLIAGTLALPDSKKGISVVRLNASTGSPSTKFNNGLPKTYDPCASLAVGCTVYVNNIAAAADSFVVSGELFGNNEKAMFAVRHSLDGVVDPSFGEDGVARAAAFNPSYSGHGMVLQGARVVLAGSAKSGDGDSQFALLRLSGGRLFDDDFENENL